MFSFFLHQLGKSVVAGRDLKKGEKLSLDNILVKCAEPHGIRPYLLDQLLGESISCLYVCLRICEAVLFCSCVDRYGK